MSWWLRLYWAFHRSERRTAYRVIGWLVKRYHWHNNVLDTHCINAPCLKVKSLVVINSYGQERVIR